MTEIWMRNTVIEAQRERFHFDWHVFGVALLGKLPAGSSWREIAAPMLKMVGSQ
jgi:hypothetical protein